MVVRGHNPDALFFARLVSFGLHFPVGPKDSMFTSECLTPMITCNNGFLLFEILANLEHSNDFQISFLHEMIEPSLRSTPTNGHRAKDLAGAT